MNVKRGNAGLEDDGEEVCLPSATSARVGAEAELRKAKGKLPLNFRRVEIDVAELQALEACHSVV